MASISRSSVLTVAVIAVLLAALPGTIWRIIQTGNPYLFTHDFFVDMFARLSGPGRMRFVLQPTVAIILGARGGVKDARAGLPPFIHAVVLNGAHRLRLLRNMFSSIRDLVALAILAMSYRNISSFAKFIPGQRCCSARSSSQSPTRYLGHLRIASCAGGLIKCRPRPQANPTISCHHGDRPGVDRRSQGGSDPRAGTQRRA